MTISKKNIIIFSSIDWSVHWQLHHQLTTSFISNGNRVLFVENTGVRSVNINDIHRINERISNWRKGLHGFSSANRDGLTLYSPMLLPFPYSKISLFLNKRIFNMSISRWIKASKFNNPIVISFLPTPLIQSAIKSIDPVLSIYYCANNMAESSISARRVRPYEDYFYGSVDIVFTAACVIQEYAETFSDKVFYFPPGIDFDKFQAALEDNKDIPNDLSNINSPIIGYIGTLGKVLDQELICTLADQCMDFTIVLIGPEYVNLDLLKEKNNIVFLGTKSHDQLPYYIKGFDVGIVPYICNDFTVGVYPSKLNEYLAMGIPAVSTNLREVRDMYSKAVIIANNTEKFIEAVKSSMLEVGNSQKQRIAVAKENSWECRFSGISNIIEKELIALESQQIKVKWKKNFNAYYYTKSKRIKIIFAAIFSFLIIMYSPFFWFIGEQLVVKESLKKTDAIVVFSGDGETSYQNLSYQKRALDAISIFENGYADKIFLSSGREQIITDVESINLFLIDSGVPPSSIHMINKYPNSTYQNIMVVKKYIDKYDVKSIIFLTSPYHSLRSSLLWKENAKDINVTIPDLRKPVNNNVKRGIKLDRIIVILYEYTSIMYNWFLGRL